MKDYAGPDVALEETAICVAGETGQIIKEARAASEPEARDAVLANLGLPPERLGLNACAFGMVAWRVESRRPAGDPH